MITHDDFNDQELAELSVLFMAPESSGSTTAQTIRRLIAALSASREEVEHWQDKYDGAIEAVRTTRLRCETAEAEVERLTQQCVTLKSYRHDYPEATAERDALRAEVERMTSLLEDDAEWHLQFDVALMTYKAAWPNPAAAVPTINAINALVNAYDGLERP